VITMDVALFAIVGVALYILLMVVIEPHRLPEMKARKKYVDSTYWGSYESCPAKPSDELRTIEITKPARKEKYIVGSGTYAAGRGVKRG